MTRRHDELVQNSRQAMCLTNAGCLVAVVGASGVGKDSIINGAKSQLSDMPRISFTRRIITRPPDTGSEQHVFLNNATFEQWRRQGKFAVQWDANGLKYALPADSYTDVINGKLVIANGSRAALECIRQAYPVVKVIHITASIEVLKQRLQQRGRESDLIIGKRLQRHASMPLPESDSIKLDNSGELSVAVSQFAETVLRLSNQHCARNEDSQHS